MKFEEGTIGSIIDRWYKNIGEIEYDHPVLFRIIAIGSLLIIDAIVCLIFYSSDLDTFFSAFLVGFTVVPTFLLLTLLLLIYIVDLVIRFISKKNLIPTKKNRNISNMQLDQIGEVSDVGLQKYYSLSDLTTIVCGASGIKLFAFDAGHAVDDNIVSLIYFNGNCERTRKYLSVFDDFSSIDKTQEFLYNLCIGTELGIRFAYLIALRGHPIGMIFIETPYFNERAIHYNHWTMDFFIFEDFESCGYMKIALPYMLLFLKEQLLVDDIHFLVDTTNSRCLNLLMNNIPVDELDNNGMRNTANGGPVRIFSCPLSKVNFY